MLRLRMVAPVTVFRRGAATAAKTAKPAAEKKPATPAEGESKPAATPAAKKDEKKKEPKKVVAGQAKRAPPPTTISFTGFNIYKNGKDPVLLPDNQYPEWLWELVNPRPPLDKLTPADGRRYFRLENKRKIKVWNMEHDKSK